MDLGLKDKSAVVLASTSGLGFGVAQALADEGARVAISGRHPDRLSAALDKLSKHGDRIFGQPMDVRISRTLRGYLNTVKEKWGTVDILVTNAGGPQPGTALEVREDTLEQAFDLTLKSAFVAISTVLPWMREQNWGRIIAMTSSSVRQPIANLALSNVLRAGLTGYLKTLSSEVAADGLTVNSICTGMFGTDRLDQLFKARAEKSKRSIEQERQATIDSIPVKRLGDPREFGDMVAFMASEKAAFLNGVALPFDGGALRSLF
jgi:3-oxoacyl-[acyl-carrier protein] reductase